VDKLGAPKNLPKISRFIPARSVDIRGSLRLFTLDAPGIRAWGIGSAIGLFLAFFLGFRRPNLITGLKTDGKHPVNHLRPKKLSWTGRPEPI